MKELKITRESIITLILVFFSLKIGCISYFSNTINILWYIGSVFCILYCFINIVINRKINAIDIFALLFYFFLLITTITNSGSYVDYLKDLLSFLSLYFVMRYGFEKNPKQYINKMYIYLMILTIINTITAIAYYPNSMFVDNHNPIFFLGGDNTSVRLYIIAILFEVLNAYILRGKKKIPFLSLINLLIFSFVRDLGGGKVCFLIMLLATLYYKSNIKIPKKIIRDIVIVNLIIFLLLVIFNKIDLFRYIIINFLHRDLSLTDRTIIWNITIEQIKNSPIIGHGMIDGMQFQSLLPYIIGVNAHNTYLMILFSGGIILFSIFTIIIIKTLRKFDAINHKRWIYIIPLTLFALMIRAQIEGWDVVWILLLLQMCYSYEKLESTDKKSQS